MVDKNLFLHDLAIVAIMKNEGHYLKEWLDYHLAAGVDHFYLYDNDSPDNQAEVAKPYVEAGLVDYFSLPGKMMQNVAYDDAVNRFKFRCRYMAFIDLDEFVYPKVGGKSICEFADEIFSSLPNAGELSISWQCFGSNGHETADYSRGVLERFTRREADDANHTIGCKPITDPRKIHHMESPHWASLFEGFFPVTERKEIKTCLPWTLKPAQTDKIVVNHYHCKSWEEYSVRSVRGTNSRPDGSKYSRAFFDKRDRNDVFDDGILHYRAERLKIYRPPDKFRVDKRLLLALTKHLSPLLFPPPPTNFFKGKLETFLTCRAVAAYLKTKLSNTAQAKIFEEAALKATLMSLVNGNLTFADTQLFLRELPNLLSLPYPVVKILRDAALQILPQIMEILRFGNRWRDYCDLDYLRRLLQTWK